jgi:GNAT superfamily N-acetyltransferase
LAPKALPEENNSISIRRLEPGDKCAGFSLGDHMYTPLKTYLKQKAFKHHSSNLAKTYVAVEGEAARIIAYIILVCGQVEAKDELRIADPEFPYSHFPAVKIARLAVNKRHRDIKLGSTLVDLAVGIAKDEVMPNVGCRFVVVDAKRPAVPFYEKMGFTLIDTPENRARDEQVMFMDLHKVLSIQN